MRFAYIFKVCFWHFDGTDLRVQGVQQSITTHLLDAENTIVSIVTMAHAHTPS